MCDRVRVHIRFSLCMPVCIYGQEKCNDELPCHWYALVTLNIAEWIIESILYDRSPKICNNLSEWHMGNISNVSEVAYYDLELTFYSSHPSM